MDETLRLLLDQVCKYCTAFKDGECFYKNIYVDAFDYCEYWQEHS